MGVYGEVSHELRCSVKEGDYDKIGHLLDANRALAVELAAMLADRSESVVYVVSRAIALYHDTYEPSMPPAICQMIPMLETLLRHPTALTRANAAELLATFAARDYEGAEELFSTVVAPLALLLRDHESCVRRKAAGAVRWIALSVEAGSRRPCRELRNAVPALQDLLSEEPDTSAEAVSALWGIALMEPGWVVSSLAAFLGAFPKGVFALDLAAAGALRCICEHDPEAGRPCELLLRQFVVDSNEVVRAHAALAMAFLGLETPDGRVKLIVESLLQDRRPVLREPAARALRRGQEGQIR